MTAPTLLITPRRSALLAGHDNELDVLVRVQAPEAPASLPARPPLHLAVVIDCSGSMSGQPLAEALRCAEFVLDGLASSDRLSIVAYDDTAQTLVAADELHDKGAVRRALRKIISGGSTNLHGGWLQGAETLAPHAARRLTSRVILLSDGCANRGLTDADAIYAQCAALAEAGVSTSTYGLGHGFNEELMIGMARHGRGCSYYGRTARDLEDPFREEFELLNALYARHLQLEVGTAPGVEARVLNDYHPADEGTWRMPDLAYGGEAWAIVRLRVPVHALLERGNGPLAVVNVALRYTSRDGESRAIPPQALSLSPLPARAFEAIAEDERVARHAGELEVARLQQLARTAAWRGDWEQVGTTLQRAERLAAANPWVKAALGELRELAARKDQAMFAKEAAYSAQRLHTRLAASDEEAAAFSAAPRAAYLRRKVSQGKGS